MVPAACPPLCRAAFLAARRRGAPPRLACRPPSVGLLRSLRSLRSGFTAGKPPARPRGLTMKKTFSIYFNQWSAAAKPHLIKRSKGVKKSRDPISLSFFHSSRPGQLLRRRLPSRRDFTGWGGSLSSKGTGDLRSPVKREGKNKGKELWRQSITVLFGFFPDFAQ